MIKTTPVASQLSVQDYGNTADSSEAITQELVNELARLELSLNESKIVVRLVSRGPAIASDISRDLSMPRTETYHYISSLLSKGVVLSTFSKPRKYYSLPFDEVVDHLVQTKYNTLRSILQNKKDYQRKLDRIASASTTATSSESEEDKSYQIIAGEDAIIARIQRILASTKGSVFGLMTERTLGLLYHGEILDKMMEMAKTGFEVEVKTSYGNAAKYFGVDRASSLSLLIVKGQTSQNSSDFIIFNNREMLLFLYEDIAGHAMNSFYINNPQIVANFLFLYQKME